jgi:antitoxin component of MazEF toxin-antitoxin module
MAQKVIKIGSSAGVTIPKKQLEELGLSIGDEVEVKIKPKSAKLQSFSKELDGFMDKYQKDLKNLAKR